MKLFSGPLDHRDVSILDIRNEALLEVERVLDEEVEAHGEARVVIRVSVPGAIRGEGASVPGALRLEANPSDLSIIPAGMWFFQVSSGRPKMR